MTDLNSLMIFWKVVESNSFSEAGRRLKMPTSTVSRRVAELEDQLGLRLLERSTRSLRLTDIGSEIMEHAGRTADIIESVESIVSQRASKVSGTLRISVPPSISDSLLAPLLIDFQKAFPEVSVQVLVTERAVDLISEGVDVVFRVGRMKDSSLIAVPILKYRHRLLASPTYLNANGSPETPEELLGHRLLAFSRWRPKARWRLYSAKGVEKAIAFLPYLSMNDYLGLAEALKAGVGIGELPPLVRPDLVRDRHLIEVTPKWQFPVFNLSLVHLGNRHISRAVRAFKEHAVRMAPKLFPRLPT